ncbi:hypothetical protein U27_01075 [Candidatus Vecturithrix granuli]|uniref:AB hydrolase-1 domain-containing protein n=1 Tax=Vecturithrix granuli TaxID=1499967 RepID=A0A081C9C1_VECG1|nr:hypothetical protein U27_01075 [Candidatus Vecturithrix granuli]
MNIINRQIHCSTFLIKMLFSLMFFVTEEAGFAEELQLSMQEISFQTRDNFTIFGSWITPQTLEPSTQKRPTVILLHDYGFNRREWGIFIPDLVERGFNVLAFDLRGHGQSKDGGLPPIEYLMAIGVPDVEAALKWVSAQKTTDKKNVNLIGVGVGADIVFLGTGQLQKKIRAAVVISPTYSTVLEGDLMSKEPRAILFCASTKSYNGMGVLAAETLSNFTKEPKKVVVYNSAAHGFTLFYKHPEIKQEILSWIGR